jgi:hypothetical protein
MSKGDYELGWYIYNIATGGLTDEQSTLLNNIYNKEVIIQNKLDTDLDVKVSTRATQVSVDDLPSLAEIEASSILGKELTSQEIKNTVISGNTEIKNTVISGNTEIIDIIMSGNTEIIDTIISNGSGSASISIQDGYYNFDIVDAADSPDLILNRYGAIYGGAAGCSVTLNGTYLDIAPASIVVLRVKTISGGSGCYLLGVRSDVVLGSTSLNN